MVVRLSVERDRVENGDRLTIVSGEGRPHSTGDADADAPTGLLPDSHLGEGLNSTFFQFPRAAARLTVENGRREASPRDLSPGC